MAMVNHFDSYYYDRFALYDPALFFVEENISDEHFNLYHTIDRTLFYRLVRKLGRNVNESRFVVAFLIWLERVRYSHNAVYKVIALPFHFVDQLADEIAGLFMCLESNNLGQVYNNLYLLQKLCSRHINLLYFHEKRINILQGVRKIVSEVCLRAFEDILTSGSHFVDAEGDRMWYAYNNQVINLPPHMYRNVGGWFPQTGFGENSSPDNLMGPNFNVVGNVLENPNADLSNLFGGMQLVNGCEDERQVEQNDRTIFLTFSKGYYIPELEVREFFTRIFGDFIEGIHMQDVSSDEQPLYARMVCHSSSIIPTIAPPGRKTKYSINGKQVWAKKYVRKSPGSTSSSIPTSE